MATIILAKDGITLQELPLLKNRITIGRRVHNDIVIDAPGISAEHAVIVTTDYASYFEDLGSTNGSRLNGLPIKKHALQAKDVIALANHTIQYRAHESEHGATTSSIFTNGTVENSEERKEITSRLQDSTASPASNAIASIKILSGIGKGKEIALTKILTTIGKPGVQVAVLAASVQGYSLTHVAGDVYPIVNGNSIGLSTQPLKRGDVIDLSGTEMMFLY
jgi:pSer/pThr/pTyr-binding forkhead associated (FHA) protein